MLRQSGSIILSFNLLRQFLSFSVFISFTSEILFLKIKLLNNIFLIILLSLIEEEKYIYLVGTKDDK